MTSIACPAYSSVLTIDLGAVVANYRSVADHVSPARCGAVVKADAYGLGARKVVPALIDAGCSCFFVAHLGEAIALLDLIGADYTLFVLNGLDPGCEELCAAHNIVPVLNSLSQVARWRETARLTDRPLPVALQIDTGMSRLGLSPAQAASLADDEDFARHVPLRLLMTHLACADVPDDPANERQRDLFQSVRERYPGVPASIANSGGAFLTPAFALDIARAGIALYGVAPHALATELRATVRLDARVIQIREVESGTGVGYGLDYIASAERRLATVGIGYADGWPRSLGGVGAAWFMQQRLPVVGRISMDSLTVDISALPPGSLTEGDFVELIGQSQSLSDVAVDAGTIPYEILTQLGKRHQRIYVDGGLTEIVPPGAF